MIAHAQDLLCKCQSARSPSQLLSSLESFFSLLRKVSRNRGLESVLRSPAVRSVEDSYADNFAAWLVQAFQQFRALLNELLNSGDPRLQEASVRYFMRLLLHDHSVHLTSAPEDGTEILFPLGNYQVMISRILQAKVFSAELQTTLLEGYIRRYTDLRYYFLLTLRKILIEGAQEIRSHKGRSEQSSSASQSYFVENGQHSGGDDGAGKASAIGEFDGVTGKEAQKEGTASRGDDVKKWYTWSHAGGLVELGRRVYPLLKELPLPQVKPGTQTVHSSQLADTQEESDDEGFLPASSCPDESDDSSRAETAGMIGGDSCFFQNIKTKKCCCPKQYRLLFQDVWVQFLRVVPLDLSLTQKLLHAVPRTLLPYMSNPLLLSDFFLSSFEKAPHLSVSVLALSGLFYLLTRHRLADPDALFTDSADLSQKGEGSNGARSGKASGGSNGVCVHFYRRLYQLITPASFSVARRGRFLRLINVALRSSLLPNSLVAAFLKKCTRVACLVPPGAGLYLIALVYSLLRKYSPVCLPLVDVHPTLAAKLIVDGDAFSFASLDFHAPTFQGTGSSEGSHAGGSGLEHESDRSTDSDHVFSLVQRCASGQHAGQETTEVLSPIKHQAQMALWELELLRDHYHYALRQLTGLIESDSNRPPCRNIDLEDYVELDLGQLLGAEFKSGAKRPSVAVAFKAGTIQGDVERLDDVCVDWVKRRRKQNITSRT